MIPWKTTLMLCLLALCLASCAGIGPGPANDLRAADGSWGPGTSVPQVFMIDNGDRMGHYAPYFYPDGGTSGRER